MKNTLIYTGLLLLIFSFTACNNSKSLSYKSIETKSKCTLKNGYWYNDKCWKEFDDDGISAVDIDEVVEKQMLIINHTKITIDGKEHLIKIAFPSLEDDNIFLIILYHNGIEDRTLLAIFPEKSMGKRKDSVTAMLLKGNILDYTTEEKKGLKENALFAGKLEMTVFNAEDLDLSFSGVLQNKETKLEKTITFTINEAITGAGNSFFEINGHEAYLNGGLGTRTYHQLKNIIDNHSEVKTIVFGNIKGSLNDAVNMHTGRILREAGLNTKVLTDSDIASGGVDLFCAGVERIVEEGAKIGIHSWCCIGDLTAIEVPREHPAHKYQIEYFSMCLGRELGTDFYFNTLESAPFDGIHWMTIDEIIKWNIATKLIEDK